MKPTDFAKYLTEFLSVYLPSQKNVSKNTIYSYRDAFKLLIKYCQETKRIPAERITLSILSSELITDYLHWLETERNSSISTRNQRLAAVHSFFRYIQYEEPSGLLNFSKSLNYSHQESQENLSRSPYTRSCETDFGAARQVYIKRQTKYYVNECFI